jgi:hypothetical protein
MPNVFPDDILAAIRSLRTDVETIGGGVDVEGGEILAYDTTTHIALVLFDSAEVANVTIVNVGGDMAFGFQEGPVLLDRADSHTYRIKVTNGVLGTEVVT